MCQLPDSVDQCGRIAHAIGYGEWELHREVGRGPALPAEVKQELLGRGGFVDGNILEEQPAIRNLAKHVEQGRHIEARLYADCLAVYNTRAKDKTDREAWQSAFSKKRKKCVAHNKELKDKNEVLEKRAKDAEAQALLLRTRIATLMSQAAKTTRISTAQINHAKVRCR